MKDVIKETINTWEEKWCTQGEGMNPEMKEELEEALKENLQERIEELQEYWRTHATGKNPTDYIISEIIINKMEVTKK